MLEKTAGSSEVLIQSFYKDTYPKSDVYWRQWLDLQIICMSMLRSAAEPKSLIVCFRRDWAVNRKTDTTNSMVRHAIHSSRGCSSTFTGGNRLLNRSVINVIQYQLEWYRPLTAKLFPQPDIATNSAGIISNVPREPGEAKIKLPRRCPSCVQNLPQTKRQPPNLHTNRSTSAPCARTNHHAELGFIVPRETLFQPTNFDTFVFTATP